jgi:hypothetical protein
MARVKGTGGGDTDPKLQSDEQKYRFGRSANKQRVAIRFDINSQAEDDIPKMWRFDATKNDWEEVQVKAFASSLLVTTQEQLNLKGDKFKSTAKGTKAGSKVWKVKVLAEKSTLTHDAGTGKPSGKPARYTTYNIPVPTWVSNHVFAHSVHARLKEVTDMVSGSGEPQSGMIVGYVSPNGRSYSVAAMNVLLSSSEPPEREPASGEREGNPVVDGGAV